MTSRKLGLAVVGASLGFACGQSSNPALLHRGQAASEEAGIEIRENARRILPEGASGEYLSGDSGPRIQLIDQFGQLTGYLSKTAESATDQGEPLTYEFLKAEGRGERVRFTTKQVHGVWYSFAGIVRWQAVSNKEFGGTYTLEGDLTSHDEASRTIQRRSVLLRLKGRFEAP